MPARHRKGRVMKIAAAIDEIDYLHLLVAVVLLINTASRIGALLEATAAQIDHALRNRVRHLPVNAGVIGANNRWWCEGNRQPQ